jgi:photosystem II stability/assembly factor-like uncharacterized protein
MKKIIVLLVALVGINGAMAQWETQNSGTTNDLNSVYFTNANTGYAVGDSGIILKTTNGGTNWLTQNSNTMAWLASVHFPSNDTGYVVGGDSTILKTTDGGINWINQASTGGSVCYNEFLCSVFFIDADTGYTAGFMWYTSPSLVGGGVLLKTVNGGIDWTICHTGGTWSIFYSVYFTSPTNGFVVGYPSINKTIDAGSSWTVEPNNEICSISVYFPTVEIGYIVGWDNPLVSGEYNFGKTTNSGVDWTYQNIGILDTLTSVYFTDTENGYIVSESGEIMNTGNGGADWTIQYSELGLSLNSVFFVDENIGYVVGEGGTILKTTNGGTIGLNESDALSQSLKIIPNPAKDKITLSSPAITGDTQLSIFNVNGEKVLERQLTQTETQIDISTLPRGVYFVKLQNEKIVEVGKMMKE